MAGSPRVRYLPLQCTVKVSSNQNDKAVTSKLSCCSIPVLTTIALLPMPSGGSKPIPNSPGSISRTLTLWFCAISWGCVHCCPSSATNERSSTHIRHCCGGALVMGVAVCNAQVLHIQLLACRAFIFIYAVQPYSPAIEMLLKAYGQTDCLIMRGFGAGMWQFQSSMSARVLSQEAEAHSNSRKHAEQGR